MRKLIEFDRLSIDGRFSGSTWWALEESGDGTLVKYGDGPFSHVPLLLIAATPYRSGVVWPRYRPAAG
jgi:hypothetical protein